MKSTVDCLAVVRWVLPIVVGLFVATAYAGPAIMSPAPVFDFGEMDNSQKVLHDFVLKNVGDEPLEISNVKTSCGCTVAKLENKTLEPGEETKISATLNLKGKQGNQSKKITVFSNDPEAPSFYLEFKGVAMATIMLEPKLLNMGRIMDNEAHTQTVTVKSMKEGHSFKIEKVMVPDTAPFTTSMEEVVPGKEYRITATTKPNLAAGTLNGRITIMTDDPGRRALNVSVYGHVIGELQLRPSVVTIRSSGDADARRTSQYLQVLPGRTKEFELLKVIAPIEGMTAELIKRKDNDYHIKLTNMPVDNSLKGKELIVTTNLPHKPEIRIPFKVLPARPVRVGKTPARVPVARPVQQPRPPRAPAAVVK
ncbi:MAG: DUF1573 domain-containing protein [Candidatus Hydrogenedentes bacterium]|nr:DUF1573 domain-containing protein [Candidatus Hydrogenedentota bacterium]